MPHQLPPLPYALDALEPHISQATLELHHGKHHQTYVTNLNNLLEGSDLASDDLVTLIQKTAGTAQHIGIFNNAAQVWNHTFYWSCLKPHGGGKPSGALLALIEQTWGSFDAFKAEFKNACLTQFGSGWAWLVKNAQSLKIIKTSNADTPLTQGYVPLLTCDVWEHAYYVDYQNRRASYVDAYLDSLVNWDFAESQYAQS